jgi:hypothetical protein
LTDITKLYVDEVVDFSDGEVVVIETWDMDSPRASNANGLNAVGKKQSRPTFTGQQVEGRRESH